MFTLGDKYRIIRKYEDRPVAFDEEYEIDFIAVTKTVSRDKDFHPDMYYITFSQAFGSNGKCCLSAEYKDGVWYDPMDNSIKNQLTWQIIKL